MGISNWEEGTDLPNPKTKIIWSLFFFISGYFLWFFLKLIYIKN